MGELVKSVILKLRPLTLMVSLGLASLGGGWPGTAAADIISESTAVPSAKPAAAPAAPETVACTVRVIHAKQTTAHAGGKAAAPLQLDPALTPLKAQLSKAPLSSWDTFKLLQQHELSLKTGVDTKFALPMDQEGTLTFAGSVDGGGKSRLRLQMGIKDAKAQILKTKFTLNNGGTLLQAGIKHDGGMLVLGFTCQLSAKP